MDLLERLGGPSALHATSASNAARPELDASRPDLGLEALAEPVRRFFGHAVLAVDAVDRTATLSMRGHIKAGAWLPFSAEEALGAGSFTWTARVGVGPLTLLRVIDRFGAGQGETEGRLLGRFGVLHADGPDTSRSAAGRLALEAVAFAPQCVLPQEGVAWRAESDDHIVATLDVPPERPEVQVHIDGRGAIRSVRALRWGNPGGGPFGYVPCGCEVYAERRFGDLVVPARFAVGWGSGTERWAPFFHAQITGLGVGDRA